MSELNCKTADRRSNVVVLCDATEGISRKLVTRRKHFFSKDFDIEIVDEDPEGAPGTRSSFFSLALTKSDVSLVFMIIALGVPVLLYSIA